MACEKNRLGSSVSRRHSTRHPMPARAHKKKRKIPPTIQPHYKCITSINFLIVFSPCGHEWARIKEAATACREQKKSSIKKVKEKGERREEIKPHWFLRLSRGIFFVWVPVRFLQKSPRAFSPEESLCVFSRTVPVRFSPGQSPCVFLQKSLTPFLFPQKKTWHDRHVHANTHRIQCNARELLRFRSRSLPSFFLISLGLFQYRYWLKNTKCSTPYWQAPFNSV